MSDPPASPSAKRLAPPGWLDGRLVLGVLLVLVSVVVGARVLSSADRSQLVWTTTRDLAPGASLRDDDLQPTQARLFGSGARYLAASGPKPVGYVLQRGLGAGELLPADALRRPEVDVDFRFVTVPVLPGHLPPDIDSGQQVDVWVTPDPAGGAGQVQQLPEAQPPLLAQDDDVGPDDGAAAVRGGALQAGARLVLPGVPVSARPAESGFGAGGSTERAVVLQVRPEDVGPLVTAMSQGRIDLVRVPKAAEAPEGLVPAGEDG